MEDKNIVVNEKTLEILVAKFIPTSQYFEERFKSLEDKFDYKFEFVQHQINEIREGQKLLKEDMDNRFEEVNKRFEEVNKRFEQVDKRFEQVNKRFEQVDKRFEQINKKFEQVDKKFELMNDKLDRILERIDTKIDNGLRENRTQAFRLFSFAMTFSAISLIGMMGKVFGLF